MSKLTELKTDLEGFKTDLSNPVLTPEQKADTEALIKQIEGEIADLEKVTPAPPAEKPKRSHKKKPEAAKPAPVVEKPKPAPKAKPAPKKEPITAKLAATIDTLARNNEAMGREITELKRESGQVQKVMKEQLDDIKTILSREQYSKGGPIPDERVKEAKTQKTLYKSSVRRRALGR